MKEKLLKERYNFATAFKQRKERTKIPAAFKASFNKTNCDHDNFLSRLESFIHFSALISNKHKFALLVIL